MKNVTMNINSQPQFPAPPPLSLTTSEKITSVSFSAQFSDEEEAIRYAQCMLKRIETYMSEGE